MKKARSNSKCVTVGRGLCFSTLTMLKVFSGFEGRDENHLQEYITLEGRGRKIRSSWSVSAIN